MSRCLNPDIILQRFALPEQQCVKDAILLTVSEGQFLFTELNCLYFAIAKKQWMADKNWGTYEFIGKLKQSFLKCTEKKQVQICDLVYLHNQLLSYTADFNSKKLFPYFNAKNH